MLKHDVQHAVTFGGLKMATLAWLNCASLKATPSRKTATKGNETTTASLVVLAGGRALFIFSELAEVVLRSVRYLIASDSNGLRIPF